MAQHDGMNVEYTNPALGHTGTSTVIPIEAYFTQIQQCLNTTLTELSELRKSHGALESRVLDMHTNANMKDDSQGEPSFAVKPYTGDKKERTEEAIITWLVIGSRISNFIPSLISLRLPMLVVSSGVRLPPGDMGFALRRNYQLLGLTLSPPSRSSFYNLLLRLKQHKAFSLSLVGNFLLSKIMSIMFGPNAKNRVLRVRNGLLLVCYMAFPILTIIG